MKRVVRSDWQAAVLICRKCQKRLGRGFGPDGRQRLAKLLRKRAGGGKGRKARLGVAEVGCLKVCPKGAVVAIRGDRPAEWLLLRPDEPIGQIATRLGIAPVLPGTGRGTAPEGRGGAGCPLGGPTGESPLRHAALGPRAGEDQAEA